jgi:hypothetical protein
MIVTGDRQHLIRTNNPDYLKHMVLLYAKRSGTRARKRMTYV